MINVETFVADVMNEVKKTDFMYAGIRRLDLPDFPIPFFGRIDKARIITVGVNPSSTEFANYRKWPEKTDVAYLANRLVCYFKNPDVDSHKWFKTWSRALNPFGIFYESGDIAHIDISPRATNKPMSRIDGEGKDLFLQMCRSDVKWLFRLIDSLSNIRFVFLAGCVLDTRWGVNEFLKENAFDYGWRLFGESWEIEPGQWIGYHAFKKGSKILPCFFCSHSPSANDKEILPNQIANQASCLLKLIEGKHPILISNSRGKITPFLASKVTLNKYKHRIHLIEKMNLFKEVKEGEWESGYWAVDKAIAEKLVGGWLFFHLRQKALSYGGGKILDYRVETIGRYKDRIIFRYSPSDECEGISAGSGSWTSTEKKIVFDI